MNIGAKLKKLRDENGYSQEFVASELGISQSTYHKLESEQIRLTVERAKQLAKLYDIDPEYFFSTEASAIYYNNGQGNYHNSINSTIETYDNRTGDLNKELFELLKDELSQARQEREKFTSLLEKFLNSQNK
ncbi:helix-turn-helix transcriptional regulator [Olivibacter sp. SDN3]|uniref:helix-turn-helix domain-containing protein n=1 Tax=Olivibacter sp. SDN3 TaxID=2764720 RepID=UPI00165121B1|nr:helix-turn-helix transcriptional regulator [Olivibacter sp. SDN3]QNL49782.1 helix-turn-helix transcriptional regulator [Olivibacter sp. SDN3]